MFTPVTLKEKILDAAINDTEIPELPDNAPRELVLIKELAEKIQNGGGGGNPNYVETIEGTINTPFGSMNKTEIASILTDALNNDATLILYGASVSIYPMTAVFPIETISQTSFSVGESSESTSYYCLDIRYAYSSKKGFSLSRAHVNSSGSGFSEIDPTTPCTLTIIHHPMPDSGT